MQIQLTDTIISELSQKISEASRATEKTVDKFIEPASGAITKAKGKRHHLIFGRRGSGKSSLLHKAQAELIRNKCPVAFIDVESFKNDTYPDVLLSIIKKVFLEYKSYLSKLNDNQPQPSKFQKILSFFRSSNNEIETKELIERIGSKIGEIDRLLKSADRILTEEVARHSDESSAEAIINASAKCPVGQVGSEANVKTATNTNVEKRTNYTQSKEKYLQHQKMDFSDLIKKIANLCGQNAFIFFDDFHYLKRSNQPKIIDYFHGLSKQDKVLWIKIGTVKHQTVWHQKGDPVLGWEIGPDAESIDLDITLEHYARAKDFLNKILGGFIDEVSPDLKITDILVGKALDRLVLASGGVARDFLNIFNKSIQETAERGKTHRGEKVGAEDVNKAASTFDESKRAELKQDAQDDQSEILKELMSVVNFCRKSTKKNMILVNPNTTHNKAKLELINELVDLRFLHRVHSGVSVRDIVGEKFEVYMLDIGQYVSARRPKQFGWIDLKDIEGFRKQELIYIE